jgi:hypothetical protein
MISSDPLSSALGDLAENERHAGAAVARVTTEDEGDEPLENSGLSPKWTPLMPISAAGAYRPHNPDRNSSMSDADRDIEQNIRTRAYLLWELEGRQEGGAEQYWHRARELIEAESQSSYPPAQSRGNRN